MKLRSAWERNRIQENLSPPPGSEPRFSWWKASTLQNVSVTVGSDYLALGSDWGAVICNYFFSLFSCKRLHITTEKKMNERIRNSLRFRMSEAYLNKSLPFFKDTDKKIVDSGGNNLHRSVFTKVKDKIPKMQKSHVVYKIPCSCKLCYVGETRNRLATREDGHH